MTRSVTITNSSNYKGEDYVVSIDWGQNGSSKTLKPGESHTFYPGSSTITFKEQESKTPEPFKEDGKQVFPNVTVEFKPRWQPR